MNAKITKVQCAISGMLIDADKALRLTLVETGRGITKPTTLQVFVNPWHLAREPEVKFVNGQYILPA
jgi:hypothetical protein